MNSENNKITENNKDKLPFSSSLYNKNNFEEFLKLEIDWNLKSIDKNDLPNELTNEICEFVNLFRKATADEKTEWNFYIDYENNEIIHCLHGNSTKVRDYINVGLMESRKILTIHNHPKGTYSAPSYKNFEILDHTFENYEIICAEKEYWILEAKGNCKNKDKIKTDIKNIFISTKLSQHNNKNRIYIKRLTKYINNLNQKIKLSKKEYR